MFLFVYPIDEKTYLQNQNVKDFPYLNNQIKN